MTTTATHTATSPYRTVDVVIDDRGLVRHPNGALLGDLDGMARLGWTFKGVA